MAGAMSKLMLGAFMVHLVLVSFGLITLPGSDLYNFLIQPEDWESNQWFSLIDDLALGLTAAAIIAGWVLTKSDLFVFAGITTVLLSFGYGYVELYTLVRDKTHPFIAAILLAPILGLYLMAAIAFWRGRSE